jgi:hypothetical protein
MCAELERLTPMNRLQTRGTVRLLLGQAGLEPHSVTVAQLLVVVDRMLPTALRSRGVSDEAHVAERLRIRLVAQGFPSAPAHEAPEEILQRFSRQ